MEKKTSPKRRWLIRLLRGILGLLILAIILFGWRYQRWQLLFEYDPDMAKARAEIGVYNFHLDWLSSEKDNRSKVTKKQMLVHRAWTHAKLDNHGAAFKDMQLARKVYGQLAPVDYYIIAKHYETYAPPLAATYYDQASKDNPGNYNCLRAQAIFLLRYEAQEDENAPNPVNLLLKALELYNGDSPFNKKWEQKNAGSISEWTLYRDLSKAKAHAREFEGAIVLANQALVMAQLQIKTREAPPDKKILDQRYKRNMLQDLQDLIEDYEQKIKK